VWRWVWEKSGATVYVTGRSTGTGKTDEGISGTIAETAAAVTGLGGKGIAIACDHRNDDENVAAVSLYPGLVRTERILRVAQFYNMSNSESPQSIGRAVAALATEYGFTDIDGTQPVPLTKESALSEAG
jgi:dehydrogenase/reductase SDR family member 1